MVLQLLLSIIVLVMSLSMFFIKRDSKILLLFLMSICFTSVVVPHVPFGNARFLMSICFFVSEILSFRRHFRLLSKTILSPILLMTCLAYLVFIIKSPHYHSVSDVIRLIIMELISKYFVIAYSFCCIRKLRQFRIIIRKSVPAFLILTFVGIINLLIHSNPFLDQMLAGRDTSFVQDGDTYAIAERFRVQAMFINPFDYGYICGLFLIVALAMRRIRILPRFEYYLLMACALFGVVTCGCRTVLFSTMIAVFIFYSFLLKKRKILLFLTVSTLFLGLCFFTVPFLHDKIVGVLSIFDTNSVSEGSSLAMRLTQYMTVFYYIQGHVLWGNGIDFFNIDMGWAEGGREGLMDKDLFGLEGVLMNYILERGIFGVLFYVLFYITIFVYLFRSRKKMKLLTSLGISILCYYMLFANMTGELLSVLPTLLFIGMILRLLYTNKREKKKECRNIIVASNNEI